MLPQKIISSVVPFGLCACLMSVKDAESSGEIVAYDDRGCLSGYRIDTDKNGAPDSGWLIEYNTATPLAEERGVLSRSLDRKNPSYFVYERSEQGELIRVRITLAEDLYAEEKWVLSRSGEGERVVHFETDGFRAEYEYGSTGKLTRRRVAFSRATAWDLDEAIQDHEAAMKDFPVPPPSTASTCYASPPLGELASTERGDNPAQPSGFALREWNRTVDL